MGNDNLTRTLKLKVFNKEQSTENIFCGYLCRISIVWEGLHGLISIMLLPNLLTQRWSSEAEQFQLPYAGALLSLCAHG